jgi:hypothetical protein
VSKEVIDNAKEDETYVAMPTLLILLMNLINRRHKYTLYLSVDGNFRLQRKNKTDDPDDVALNKGNGYFVENNAFKEYNKIVGETNDVCPELGPE